MTKIVVGVTGINSSDNPAPGIGVAKSLKQAFGDDIELIGLAYDALEPGIFMEWLFSKSFLMPYPSSESNNIIERLKYIIEKTGMQILIPNLDSELPFYIKYVQQLKNLGIKVAVPSKNQFEMRDKLKLSEIAMQAHVMMPKQREVTSYSELEECLKDVEFPAMIKGAMYRAYVAYNFQDATRNFNRIVAEFGYPVIVQKVIVGEEVNVVGVGDGKGNVLGMVAIKKLARTELGKIWSGVTIKNKQLQDLVSNFIGFTKWQGPFELECMLSDNVLCMIEVNPRFPAWCYFATAVNVNLPEILIKMINEENPKPCSEYEAGKFYVRYINEYIGPMDKFQSIATTGETQSEEKICKTSYT